jgi:hypothetical protein
LWALGVLLNRDRWFNVLQEIGIPCSNSTPRIGESVSLAWTRSTGQRGNAKVWEGRALIGGRVSKVTINVVLTANVIKQALALPLDQE